MDGMKSHLKPEEVTAEMFQWMFPNPIDDGTARRWAAFLTSKGYGIRFGEDRAYPVDAGEDEDGPWRDCPEARIEGEWMDLMVEFRHTGPGGAEREEADGKYVKAATLFRRMEGLLESRDAVVLLGKGRRVADWKTVSKLLFDAKGAAFMPFQTRGLHVRGVERAEFLRTANELARTAEELAAAVEDLGGAGYATNRLRRAQEIVGRAAALENGRARANGPFVLEESIEDTLQWRAEYFEKLERDIASEKAGEARSGETA